MSSKKRIWSKDELTIAYYIAKWGYAGLRISEYDFAEYIIGNTSIPSLKMQVANFRYLLGIDGFKLEDASKAMKDLTEELSNSTITQVRRMILNYVDSCNEKIEIEKSKSINKQVNKRRDELNEQYDNNFKAKLNMMQSQGRRLRKKINYK